MLEKNLSNDKSLEVNVAISRKKLCCTIFDKKNDRKQGEPKSPELTVWNYRVICISKEIANLCWGETKMIFRRRKYFFVLPKQSIECFDH